MTLGPFKLHSRVWAFRAFRLNATFSSFGQVRLRWQLLIHTIIKNVSQTLGPSRLRDKVKMLLIKLCLAKTRNKFIATVNQKMSLIIIWSLGQLPIKEHSQVSMFFTLGRPPKRGSRAQRTKSKSNSESAKFNLEIQSKSRPRMDTQQMPNKSIKMMP